MVNRCRKNASRVNPTTSGPRPTNSQNTGWSLYAETIVPRSTSEKANPKPLMSPVVQFSLIDLFIESRSEYWPSSAGLLSGPCAACRSFAENNRRWTQIYGDKDLTGRKDRKPQEQVFEFRLCGLCDLLLSSYLSVLSRQFICVYLRSSAVVVFFAFFALFASIPSGCFVLAPWVSTPRAMI
jgi:hypothetical protein